MLKMVEEWMMEEKKTISLIESIGYNRFGVKTARSNNIF